jgi:ribonuclease R
VTRFGLFVTLPESGASGFLSMASLPNDFWMHDEATQSLIGKRSRKTYQLAQMLDVRLAEARPVTGGLLFTLAAAPAGIGTRGPRPGKKTGPKHKTKRRR